MANNSVVIFSKAQVEALEKSINYQFKDLDLLHEALSHPSLKQRGASWDKTYERFEILGDAILGFLITELLFKKYQKSDEGNIAKVKAYLVSKDTLCHVAEKIKLADFIIMTKGEEDSGGRTNPNNIENTMEALIGSIYLDSTIDNVRNIVTTLWSEFLHDFDLKDIDPKTFLQEWSQGNKYGMPHYELISKEGAAHTPLFKVCVSVGPYKQTGSGHSIKDAEKAAARELLKMLSKA